MTFGMSILLGWKIVGRKLAAMGIFVLTKIRFLKSSYSTLDPNFFNSYLFLRSYGKSTFFQIIWKKCSTFQPTAVV